jgi:hypothetical protein
MVKVGFVATVCAAAVAAIGATSALGGGPPIGNCPVGFELKPTSFLSGFSVGGLQSADLNGNQMTCVKLLNTPSDIVFMDDVVPH